jgi:hypothetical protein
MSGSRAAFVDMDTTVYRAVRFGDDFMAQIEGSGSVLCICKNGEHRCFADVYYIPRLTVNIVSVGQHDESGFDVHIRDGVMCVHELSG